MGSLVARWGRTFTPRWFKIHRLVNFAIALPVIVCGFLLGLLAVSDRKASHFSDAHRVRAIILVSNPSPSGEAVAGGAPHPPTNILHAVFGILLIGLSFFQVRSGLAEWAKSTGQEDLPHWCRDALAAWAVILPVLYTMGLALLRRQFANEKKQGMEFGESPEGKNYITLASADSPILFDAEHDHDIPGYSELESGVPLLRRP
ncbi:hypothetical protein DFH07DRAFT_966052 [Mycena maculata]|uniref:Cytochrome b561 domain-containing protein n=1 Tax=Mycena maculata TaxID=230809 RepID=A0AAD7MZ28_9AGAR|nr:hypothetical protein DFH07DRAFT_966052 [Mycena maculata]